MTPLERVLRQLPGVYGELEEALVPTRRVDPPDASPDPRDRPAPANLRVADHRHKLVRGLRWWVDALREAGEHTQVGHDVALMCRWLWDHHDVLEPEDEATLTSNLRGWLVDAAEFLGVTQPVDVTLPVGALDQRVRVADAARILGCTVRTVQRRVPAEQRGGGLVLLREAWRCESCDLRHGECAHTHSLTIPVA